MKDAGTLDTKRIMISETAIPKKAMKAFCILERILNKDEKMMQEMKYVTVYTLEAIPIREEERQYFHLR